MVIITVRTSTVRLRVTLSFSLIANVVLQEVQRMPYPLNLILNDYSGRRFPNSSKAFIGDRSFRKIFVKITNYIQSIL